MDTGNFYIDKPVFGLDVGFGSIKVMQITEVNNKKLITGYGIVDFDPKSIKDGVIIDPESLAKATKNLFEKGIIGEINTRRASIAIPVARTYNRAMSLPKMNAKDLDNAVILEAEQYIPVPSEDLYIDYIITSEKPDGVELLVVAVPKTIVDSYLTYADLIGIEISAFETTIAAAARLVEHTKQDNMPTILADVGSISADITIFDKQLIVTGTVAGGSDTYTEIIAKKLDVSDQIAYTIKTKYGLNISKKQRQITEALKPMLDALTKEMRKMIRYYDDRTKGKSKIEQVLTIGGGANMPGLSEYLTNELRLPARMFNPWDSLDFGHLQQPNDIQKSMYITVAGLALIDPKEIWK
jgi:type IV pilus assembly protein PilM